MADYAAPVALGIKVPDAMSTLGSVFSAATSAQNLKGAQLDYQRKQATLPADIARAQAESSAAQSNATVQAANVGSNITQATEAAKQSQIATHSQQYKFGSEVAGKVLDIGKGLYSSDSASKAELAKTPEELNDASAGLTDDVLAARDRAYDVTGDRKKVDIQFAPLLAKAAHDPANFRKFLLPIINQGATPGTITPNGPVLDTGQQAVPMNVSPAAGPTGPIVGAGVQKVLPPTTQVVDPNTNIPHALGPQPSATPAATPQGTAPAHVLVDQMRNLEKLDSQGKQAMPGTPNDAVAARIAADLQKHGIAWDHGNPVRIDSQAPPAPQLGPQTGLAPNVVPNISSNVSAADKDFSETQASANSAARDIGVLQHIKALAPRAITGTGSDYLAYVTGLANIIGFKGNPADLAKTSTDELIKNSSMLGLGGNTDAMRTLLLAANPNNHMSQQAIINSANQVIAQRKLAIAKNNFMTPLKTGGNENAYLSGLARWAAHADPRIVQYQDMSPQEKKDFIGGLNNSEYTDLKTHVQALKEMGAIK